MSVAAEIQSLSPSAIIELFALDSTSIPGGDVMYFHAGTNELFAPIVWQGITYNSLPIEAEGFDVTTKGAAPRPKVRVANVDGLLSAVVAERDDLVGAKFIRKRTFAKYLDSVNYIKNNWLLWSKDMTNAVWAIKTGITATYDAVENATRLTVTTTADPYYGQKFLTNPANRTFTFDIEVKGVDTTVGKIVEIYLYGDTPFGDVVAKNFTLTSEWQKISITNVFDGVARTGVIARVDPANTAFAIGEYVLTRNPQVSETAASVTYDESGASWNPDADPNQHFQDDVWYVEQKVSENRYVIEWELASAFDIQGVMLPSRQVIQNTCTWTYRSSECGYTGTFFDTNDAPCAAPNDFCAKRLASCRVRFPKPQPIPFGGFPGATRVG